MHTDRYGCPLSTSSPAAREAYVDGVDAILAGQAGDEAALERSLEADPEFALAHAALARARFLRAKIPQAREALAVARACAQRSSERERGHVAVLALPIEGRTAEALEATREHLQRWPRDAMVAAPATGVFGLIGFSGQQERETQMDEFLEWLAPHYAGDWWFDCEKAFAECESGQLARARPRIEASLAVCPGNARGAHVKAHVLYELGEHGEALRFLGEWMPGCAKQAVMHCHLSWHRAISALATGDREQAWRTYLESVHPGAAWGPPVNVATDAAAFLWRFELDGSPRLEASWREVNEYCRSSFPKAGVFFVDVHAALALAAVGDLPGLERLAGELRDRVAKGRLPPGAVVPGLVEALGAWGRGDWSAAAEGLERALPETVRIGGSRAQRDVIARTLFAAYLKAGREDDARRMARH